MRRSPSASKQVFIVGRQPHSTASARALFFARGLRRAENRSSRGLGGIAVAAAATVLERFPFVPRVEHFAGRAALVLADNAVLGHEVDESRSAAIADA